ncbi:MAG: UDP-2,4-diacetamido-2,4,6-trideoxy-beta-L-altropyranose hydrolase [Lachnospiraceae bacterium]
MKTIYIRVDGNEIIATGHVMRCLSVAEQLRELGLEVVFIVADNRPGELIQSRNFQMHVLYSVWDDLNQETEQLCEYIIQHRVKVLLLDSYYVTKEYLQKLSQYTKIVYIDDLFRFDYAVHTLINYSAFAGSERYRELYGRENRMPEMLLGSAYIPLRKEFAYQPYSMHELVKKVLVTTGGTDQLNVTGNILDKVIEHGALMQLEYHVIIGCFNQNKEHLYALGQQYSNIQLHENITNMSDWMRECDIAISAGGTTLYELCACGIPTICLEVADNQDGAVNWEKNDYMQYAGNAYKNMESCVKKCIEALYMYNEHQEIRERRSRRMQELVDGNGAKRIAEYMDKIMEG